MRLLPTYSSRLCQVLLALVVMIDLAFGTRMVLTLAGRPAAIGFELLVVLGYTVLVSLAVREIVVRGS